jgi:perosamine synthetase
MTAVRIPISRPLVGDDELARIKAVLDSGWLTQGEATFEFERLVASYCGAKHAVAMNSATTALHVALVMSGVAHGDEVIVPSYSHIATANSVFYTGAMPVFVDISRSTYNMDAHTVEDAITDRTRAIVVVHQVGLPVDLQAIGAIARRHGLTLIEDAACALGSGFQGRRIGAHGNVVVFSFHPRKVITTGEGGMILTDDPGLASSARSLASHGEAVLDVHRHNAVRPTTEEFARVGFNYRMTNVQGAIGIGQMSRLDEILESRRALAHRYTSRLKGLPGLEVPVEPDGFHANYQSYMVRITPDTGTARDDVMLSLRESGIATRPGITAIHLQPPYRVHADPAMLVETQRAVDEALILPLYPQMTEQEQDEVIDRIVDLVGGNGDK